MRTPVPSRRVVIALAWLATLAVIVLGVFLFGQVVSLSASVHDGQSDRSQLKTELDNQHAASTALAKQVRRLGGTPVVAPGNPGPAGNPGAAGARGVQGPRGETGARGPRGYKGDTGTTGIGQTGTSGSDGQTGATGPVGPPGPKGDPGPSGPSGADGKNGVDGKDGTATPGTYSCPGGQVLQGFSVAADGTVTLDCVSPVGIPAQ